MYNTKYYNTFKNFSYFVKTFRSYSDVPALIGLQGANCLEIVQFFCVLIRAQIYITTL